MDDMPDPTELAELAAQAKRYFRWDVMLALVAMGILVVSLQIQRSLARQQVEVSRLLGRTVVDGRGPAPDVAAAGDDSSVGGGGRGDAVDGSPGMAAGENTPPAPKPSRGRGVAKRPEGDGP